MIKYKKIYSDIKKKIINHNFEVNRELPTENELMTYYSVSKDTIRKALSLLEIEGYISKRQGKNSTVIGHGMIDKPYVSEIKSIHELNQDSKHDIETKLINLIIIQGQEDIMQLFETNDKADFYKVERTRCIDGENIEYEVSYFDRQIVPYLNKNIAQNSIYQYLENELKLPISYSRREISFRYANKEELQYMDLDDFKMVVEVKSKTYLSDGTLFQYGSISYRPDKITFVSIANRKK